MRRLRQREAIADALVKFGRALIAHPLGRTCQEMEHNERQQKNR
jgi:hypothetical protein